MEIYLVKGESIGIDNCTVQEYTGLKYKIPYIKEGHCESNAV